MSPFGLENIAEKNDGFPELESQTLGEFVAGIENPEKRRTAESVTEIFEGITRKTAV